MRKLLALLLLLTGLPVPALAVDEVPEEKAEPKRWQAPFGGTFNANVTVASDYSYSGISNTGRSPAFQMGLDWRSPNLFSDAPPVWIYATAWGTNVWFPATGGGEEIDLSGGVKFRLLERKLKVDIGYLRYFYPGVSAELAYDYGEIQSSIEYDFGWLAINGRLRFSPNAFGNAGQTWNKRAFVSAPLSFLKLGEDVAVRIYGSIGNLWVERFRQYGIPKEDYWYGQAGFLVHAFGLDFNLAYTATSIDYAGCGNTDYCAPRAFLSVSKVF